MKKYICPYPAPQDPKNNPATRKIYLTKGKFATVDTADFDWVARWKWCAIKPRNTWYAIRRGDAPGRETIYMHRVLMFACPGEQVDHEDGDGLNNTRKNLRRCTHQGNSRGFQRKAAGKTSKYRGVSWESRSRKWVAQIHLRPGAVRRLGYFSSEEEAGRAYVNAVRLHFGAFAESNLNA